MPGAAADGINEALARPLMSGPTEVTLICVILLGAIITPFFTAKKDATTATRGVTWAASLAIALLLIQLVLVAQALGGPRPGDMTAPDALVNFGFAILIGLLVGATEMISRYRDDPFAPLISMPGALYILINGGASALAYYLLRLLAPDMSEPLRTFTAGIAAMTFFRSSLFTVRLAGADVPVGPNLVLLTVLKALDRAYDRTRAEPRSAVIREIMGQLAFDQVKNALPALCFDLMQNLSSDELSAINTQVTQLSQSTAMSDRSKSLSLGLALLNLVGERTLRAAVTTLGSSARAFRRVDNSLMLKLAGPPPQVVLDTLPGICAALYQSASRDQASVPTPQFSQHPNLSTDSQVVLLAYQLVNFYGDELVAVASQLVKAGTALPPATAPTPVGAVAPQAVTEAAPAARRATRRKKAPPGQP
jgi:hypothetical protein